MHIFKKEPLIHQGAKLPAHQITFSEINYESLKELESQLVHLNFAVLVVLKNNVYEKKLVLQVHQAVLKEDGSVTAKSEKKLTEQFDLPFKVPLQSLEFDMEKMWREFSAYDTASQKSKAVNTYYTITLPAALPQPLEGFKANEALIDRNQLCNALKVFSLANGAATKLIKEARKNKQPAAVVSGIELYA